MQSLIDAFTRLVFSGLSLLIGPTVVFLLLRIFLPAVGNPIWQAYCRFLGWLLVAPVRLIRLLYREATGRRHH